MKAKSSKKSSDEDRSRLKKLKSEKRKKKPRKSKESKKKSRKKPRQVSTPSTSSSYSSDYSISSCSTCEKRKATRSRSPISRGNRKSKLRKSRVSTSSKYKGRERGRRQRRSGSCSSTSSSKRSRSTSRSRSSSRSKRLRKEIKKEEKAQVSRLVESGSEERDKVIPVYDNVVSPSKDDKNKMQRGTKESKPIGEVAKKAVPGKTQNASTKNPGVVDAELILRQKALENFIKFHKFKKCNNGEEGEQPVSNEENKEVGSAQGAMATDKEREEPVLDEPTEVITDKDLKEQEKTIADTAVKRPKIRSVITIPTEREISEDNTVIDPYNTGEASNHIAEVGSEPNPSSWVASDLRKNERHESTSGGVETGGADYEKKTFSRLHDGEMVQMLSAGTIQVPVGIKTDPVVQFQPGEL